MENQKHLFSLADDIVYLNNAYMSPSLKSVEQAGVRAVLQKNTPDVIRPNDFFTAVAQVKQLYSELIDNNDPERIAIIPSVSYGMANVVNNIKLNAGDEIILIEDQFPSNVYSWKRLASQSGATLKVIHKPETNAPGKDWNNRILEAISDKTAVLSMAHVHWADGTLFNLKEIRRKTRNHNTLFIIDGTQSVGALPLSVSEIDPDALICGAYKWLMGPYSIGLAYYGAYFDTGIPIEESWMNRLNSENFDGLTQYE
ncbi:MAG: aminotransferase class V-fold PLP-dependent enzyme, partial [Flavobacteriaceae bacterium]|nr:aminotransferase class V-fold PLP-dependent enzyme [Flavobacteriaceae bacterium]